MRNEARSWGLQTRLVHEGDESNETTAVSPPIYQTSTYRLPSAEEGAQLAAAVAPARYYTRYGSPNGKHAEALLTGLEGSEAALVLGSGMAAISTAIMSNVGAGGHVLAQRTHYTGTLTLLAEVLPQYGIEVTQVDQRDPDAFARAIRPSTKVVYTESPSNPLLDVTDLVATAELARGAGAVAIADNTFATPYNQRPIDFGYDLVVHSATKYLGGHADVTAGAILGRRELVERAWEHARVLGPVLHPFEAWLLVRGLRTFGLRMAAHNANAMEVARFLEAHPAVERVHYPGLESHPGHDLAKRQMPGGYGGMMAFELKGGYEAAYKAVERTEVCVSAVSLGSVETLITHAASMVFGHQTEDERVAAGISPSLIRLSVGIEDAQDIVEDLDQALS